MRSSGHIVSGHSMGAHGALIMASVLPSSFSCAAILSGWLRKENYGNSNAFFSMDNSMHLVDSSNVEFDVLLFYICRSQISSRVELGKVAS